MARTKIKTSPWDVAEHLRDEQDICAYIEAAQEEAGDDAAFMAAVLGDVARAQSEGEIRCPPKPKTLNFSNSRPRCCVALSRRWRARAA